MKNENGIPNWMRDERTPEVAINEWFRMKEGEAIRVTAPQTRFESWAADDIPVIIDPCTISISEFRQCDLNPLVDIYVRAFNSQNQRLYSGNLSARLIWDEEPWNDKSALAQLESELSQPQAVCFVARANTVDGNQPIGFIVGRPVDIRGLMEVCGKESIANNIFNASDSSSELLLWEDAAVLNMKNQEGQSIRGVGSKLYRSLANLADYSKLTSIGRTSPGSFSENILPKLGFLPITPMINDGKDRQRYWLIRKYEK